MKKNGADNETKKQLEKLKRIRYTRTLKMHIQKPLKLNQHINNIIFIHFISHDKKTDEKKINAKYKNKTNEMIKAKSKN